MKTLEQADALSEQDKKLLIEIKRVIQALLPAAEAMLYGSAARGVRGPESDYDILVLTDKPLTRDEERTVDNAIYDLELAHEVVLSTLYCSKRRWDKHPAMPFHIEVRKDGIVL
ncbi:MAG TPA: nucleotidyltransferase domain-containing protein [Candidatus Hydrogenedentes bacterium]|nr:nucleotidyltransferase domain-containing protein [Candidatus Hydrogenedentota bacterium]HIJ72467.1 nucleotidyltransferase domain-containing protein [Candidatus Hydrogenedentota bacterium]